MRFHVIKNFWISQKKSLPGVEPALPMSLKMCATPSGHLSPEWKGGAVLLDIHECETLQEKIELLTDMQTGVNQIENGKGVDHEQAKEQVLRQAAT
jgi:hypothetical protein